MSDGFSKWFAEAIAMSAGSRAEAGKHDSQQEVDEKSNEEGYIINGIVYDAQGNIVDELPLEDPDFPFDPTDLLGYGFGLKRLFNRGNEFVLRTRSGKIKIAPFGNRTGDPWGRWPHYHVGRKDSSGAVRRGQGTKRHRPWEPRKEDEHWWDRF